MIVMLLPFFENNSYRRRLLSATRLGEAGVELLAGGVIVHACSLRKTDSGGCYLEVDDKEFRSSR